MIIPFVSCFLLIHYRFRLLPASQSLRLRPRLLSSLASFSPLIPPILALLSPILPHSIHFHSHILMYLLFRFQCFMHFLLLHHYYYHLFFFSLDCLSFHVISIHLLLCSLSVSPLRFALHCTNDGMHIRFHRSK